jgi:hypothetical protein
MVAPDVAQAIATENGMVESAIDGVNTGEAACCANATKQLKNEKTICKTTLENGRNRSMGICMGLGNLEG